MKLVLIVLYLSPENMYLGILNIHSFLFYHCLANNETRVPQDITVTG